MRKHIGEFMSFFSLVTVRISSSQIEVNVMLLGASRPSRHTILGDERQERDERRASIYDHGGRD